MNDPDWGRYMIRHPDAQVPVGNPIYWCGAARTAVGGPYPAVDLVTGCIIMRSEPIVSAATLDGYGREWSLIGSLTLARSIYYLDYFVTPTVPQPGTFPLPAAFQLNAYAEITVGNGRQSFQQKILLACMGDPLRGLCNTQSAVNGGPYGEYPVQEENPLQNLIARPFAAPGSLVGSTVVVRACYEIAAGGNEWPDATLAVSLCPIAAGKGL